MTTPRLCLLVLAVLLAACGGGGGGSSVPVVVAPPPPVRGALLGAATVVPVLGAGNVAVNRLDPQVFALLLNGAQPGTTSITSEPKCAITTYALRYNTLGGQDEATDASAAVMLPSGSDPACAGARPVLLYAHGTSVERSFNMADLAGNSEARLIAAMFAAQGFIVVAPNYAGYDKSTLAYHPYLNADQQSNDMVDALRAARNAFASIGASASAQLFVTGYSQGGHVALATERAMQTRYASEFKVSAAAPLSGPYALLRFGDSIFGGSPSMGVTAFLPLLINAGQKAGAGVYGLASEVYEAQYASGIETLLPGGLTLGALASQGKLPASALFARDSLPQGAGSGEFFGDQNLVKSSYRSAYLVDQVAQPCNVNPADPLACAPQNGLRKLLLKNDLRTYLPSVPMLLCGGHNDPTVPFYNTDAAYAYFNAKGMAPALLNVLDLESASALLGDYRDPVLAFGAAKLALIAQAARNGENTAQAVASNYHAGLVAPFCLMAARTFFQAPH